MPRIYLTGSSLGRGYITGSGVISNPPRTILQLKDNATSSYPTVSRIGDPGRTGRYAINFNDTKSIVFNSNVTTSYPANLQLADAAYISQSVATPNTNATIEATGIVRKGVADANIMFTPGEDLKPFVDDSLYASTKSAFTDPFYLTGSTVADVGLGFTAPLRSKTKIEIDIPVNTTSQFGFSTEDYITPMVYYNFLLGTWEPVAFPVNVTKDNTGATSRLLGISTGSAIGFTRGAEMLYDVPLQNCRPTTTFGFPINERYFATGSQTFPVSSLIDKPFLVEKVIWELDSVSFNMGNDNPAQRSCTFADFTQNGFSSNAIDNVDTRSGGFQLPRAAINTLFILNQRSPFSASLGHKVQNLYTANGMTFPAVTSSLPKEIVLTPNGIKTNVTASRDMITYNQVTSWGTGGGSWETYYPMLGTTGALNLGLSRELTIGPVTYNAFNNIPLIISGAVKVASSYESTNLYRFGLRTSANEACRIIPANAGGRRADIMSVSGRGLNAEVPGSPLIGSYRDFGAAQSGQGTTDSSNIVLYQNTDTNSPYLIMPGDELVIGAQVACPFGWRRATDGAFASYKGPNLSFNAGHGKLTLYGSLITEAHEHHDGLNQPLTSDAVHEFIGFHGPPLDQFDTEPRQQFSGSMFSNVVTGALAGTAGNERGIKGQRSDSAWLAGNPTKVPNDDMGITAQQAVTKNLYPHRSPSFSRTIIYEESNGRFYDSCTPNAFDIYNIDGKSYDIGTGFGYILALGGPEVLYNGSLWGNSSWPRMFPFEGRFKGVRKNISSVFPEKPSTNISSGKVKTLGFGGITLPISPLGASNDGMQIALPYGNTMYGRQNIEKTSKEALTIIKNTLWGFGSNCVSGTVGYFHCTAIGTYSAPKQPEGFKYGLYHANFKNVFCHFSANNYGQFRDMLEQRLDTRFYSETSGRSTISSSPVQARFVSSDGTSESPSKTSCSNLSQFVTSSLPYFDGVARNRGPIVPADLGLSIVSI